MPTHESPEQEKSPREIVGNILEIQQWLSSDEVHFGNALEDQVMRKNWADRQYGLQEQLRQIDNR